MRTSSTSFGVDTLPLLVHWYIHILVLRYVDYIEKYNMQGGRRPS